MALKQLKRKDLKYLREKWHKEQKGICPLFGHKFPLEEGTLDHQHKLKAELPDETGKGLCRGVLQFQANSIEGKMTNAFKRYGGHYHIDIISFLRNLADYLESNKIHTDEQYIHPSEEVRPPKLMKSSYNKLVKAVGSKQKIPKYTGKFTKPIEKLFEKYNVLPVFKKSSTPVQNIKEEV